MEINMANRACTILKNAKLVYPILERPAPNRQIIGVEVTASSPATPAIVELFESLYGDKNG